MQFTNLLSSPIAFFTAFLILIGGSGWANQDDLATQLSVQYAEADDSLVFNFLPNPTNDGILQIERSADLVAWEIVAFRSVGGTAWQSLINSVAVEVDSSSGLVTASIPANNNDCFYARLTSRGASSDDIDEDNDNIPDWLEEHVETNVPEGLDSDGDGISDQVEQLTGTNPHGDDFALEQERIASFTTNLRVFTPTVK